MWNNEISAHGGSSHRIKLYVSAQASQTKMRTTFFILTVLALVLSSVAQPTEVKGRCPIVFYCIGINSEGFPLMQSSAVMELSLLQMYTQKLPPKVNFAPMSSTLEFRWMWSHSYTGLSTPFHVDCLLKRRRRVYVGWIIYHWQWVGITKMI